MHAKFCMVALVVPTELYSLVPSFNDLGSILRSEPYWKLKCCLPSVTHPTAVEMLVVHGLHQRNVHVLPVTVECVFFFSCRSCNSSPCMLFARHGSGATEGRVGPRVREALSWDHTVQKTPGWVSLSACAQSRKPRVTCLCRYMDSPENSGVSVLSPLTHSRKLRGECLCHH